MLTREDYSILSEIAAHYYEVTHPELVHINTLSESHDITSKRALVEMFLMEQTPFGVTNKVYSAWSFIKPVIENIDKPKNLSGAYKEWKRELESKKSIFQQADKYIEKILGGLYRISKNIQAFINKNPNIPEEVVRRYEVFRRKLDQYDLKGFKFLSDLLFLIKAKFGILRKNKFLERTLTNVLDKVTLLKNSAVIKKAINWILSKLGRR